MLFNMPVWMPVLRVHKPLNTSTVLTVVITIPSVSVVSGDLILEIWAQEWCTCWSPRWGWNKTLNTLWQSSRQSFGAVVGSQKCIVCGSSNQTRLLADWQWILVDHGRLTDMLSVFCRPKALSKSCRSLTRSMRSWSSIKLLTREGKWLNTVYIVGS